MSPLNEVAPWNIDRISVTLSVSQPLMFPLKDVAPENIPPISATLLVFQVEKPVPVSDEQRLNMLATLVTPLRSGASVAFTSRLLQPQNAPSMVLQDIPLPHWSTESSLSLSPE